jgi:hypothetical protein
VLFHLRDVSRPRQVKTPTPAEATPVVAHAPVEMASPIVPPFPPVAAPPDELTEFRLQDLELPASKLVETRVYEMSLAAERLAASSDAMPENLPSLAKAVETVTQAEATSDSASSVDEPAATASPPTHRLKSPPLEDWFAAHGKFIAAGFVLALCGTVYFARTTRKQGPVASNPAATAPLLAETETALTPTISVPKVESLPPLTAVAESKGRPGAAEESKVELQLPVATPQDSTAAVAEKPASGGDSLFVFQPSKRGEERVASLPQVTAASANAPAPPATTDAGPQMPLSYPVTSSPPLYQGTPAAGPGYPTHAAPAVAPPPMPPGPTPVVPPAAGFQPGVPPQGWPQQSWSPPAAAPPMAGPYQSPQTIARGPRYERTGSGNY